MCCAGKSKKQQGKDMHKKNNILHSENACFALLTKKNL